jgi:hypothetical protein
LRSSPAGLLVSKVSKITVSPEWMRSTGVAAAL